MKSDGRDSSGRFTAGNGFGKGNPNNLRVARLRQALLRAVDEGDLEKAARALLAKAVEGDVTSFRELCDRVLGRPSSSDLVARVERLEAMIEENEL